MRSRWNSMGLAVMMLGCAVGGIRAQTTYTWTGGGASDNFSDTGNWGGANGNQTGIQTFAGTNRLTPYADGSTTFNTYRIYFQTNAGSFAVSGREITLSDYGGSDPSIRNLGTNVQTILNNLRGDSTANDDPLRVQANGGDLILMGNITNRGSALIISGASSSRYVALGGQVTGNPNIEIDSAQLRILEGASIDQVGGGIYVGNGTSTSTPAALLIADLNGGTTVGKIINVNSGDGLANTRLLGAMNTSGTNTFSGNIVRDVSGNRAITLAQSGGGTVDFNGVISGDHKVLIEGPGIVRFGGVNTYATNTEINSGQLHVKEGAVISAAGARVYVGNGATVGTSAGLYIADLNGGTTVGQGIRVNPGQDANRTLGGLNTSGTNTFSGAIDMSGSGDRSATLQAQSGGAVRFDGVISGGGGITTSGGGVVDLRAANTYSGATTVASGTLLANNASGSATGSGTVTVQGGGSLGGGGTILTSSLVVENGGSLAPGGLQSLSVDLGSTGQARFDSGAYLTFSLTLAGVSDQVEFLGSGTITFNNNPIHFVDLTGGLLEVGATYDLFRIGDESTVVGSLVIGTGLEAYAGSTLSVESGVVRLQTNAIPEPTSMILLGLGATVIGVSRRRRL